MNISPHLLIDTVILSTALTITLVLRAKGNAARHEKESKWLLKIKKKYWDQECIAFPTNSHCKLYCD